VPRGFQEVKVPTLRDNGPGWWQGCQPYPLTAFTARKYSWYSFLLEADCIHMVYGIFNKLSFYFISFCFLYVLHTAALNTIKPNGVTHKQPEHIAEAY